MYGIHVVCVYSDGQITCCVCRQVSLMSNMIDNMFVAEVQPLANDGEGGKGTTVHNCTGCEDNVTASHFCTDCSEWLCEPCAQAHRRVKVTKDHSIEPVSKISENGAMSGTSSAATLASRRHLMCPTHPKEPLKLYCETCVKLTCRDCQLGEHRHHKYKFVQVVFHMCLVCSKKLHNFKNFNFSNVTLM